MEAVWGLDALAYHLEITVFIGLQVATCASVGTMTERAMLLIGGAARIKWPVRIRLPYRDERSNVSDECDSFTRLYLALPRGGLSNCEADRYLMYVAVYFYCHAAQAIVLTKLRRKTCR